MYLVNLHSDNPKTTPATPPTTPDIDILALSTDLSQACEHAFPRRSGAFPWPGGPAVSVNPGLSLRPAISIQETKSDKPNANLRLR